MIDLKQGGRLPLVVTASPHPSPPVWPHEDAPPLAEEIIVTRNGTMRRPPDEPAQLSRPVERPHPAQRAEPDRVEPDGDPGGNRPDVNDAADDGAAKPVPVRPMAKTGRDRVRASRAS
jgi:hypothetical protein